MWSDQRNPKVSDSEELPSECLINPPCQVFNDYKRKPERSERCPITKAGRKNQMADN